MTKSEARRILAQLDPETRRRVAVEATIQIAVKLRNEGVEFQVEYEDEVYKR